MGKRPATHSNAHVNEACYHALRRALFPNGFPLERDGAGRFCSPKRLKTDELRAELQAQSNVTLEDAIERMRAA